jgi:predicted RNA-binding Zn-ribbon protein involved in translation (DUF1610 family)
MLLIVASIRAECPSCGDVRLRPGDLTVRRFGADESGTYTFACPHCGDVVTRPASARIVSLLASAGVHQEQVAPPAEIFERHSGPPIAADDLIDFHMLLEGDGWVERLNEMVRGAGN